MTPEAWEHARRLATSPIAKFLVNHLNLGEATGDPDAVWEDQQIEYLNLAGIPKPRPIAVNKTRQFGFSWAIAAEAVGRSIVYPRSLTNIVSINKDEAEEKIRYARLINDALHPEYRIRGFKIDNRGELETDTGSRIRSHACTPPRGRPGAHHRLDEIAHYQTPQLIYNAAFAGTVRKGSIACISSPWVRGGFHYQLMEEPDVYRDFTRMWIPWWEVYGLCRDVERAKLEAPALPTAQRVEMFGSDRLQYVFRNMTLDAFQTECELAYADDSMAWLSWEEIMACTGPGDMDWFHASDMPGIMAAVRAMQGAKWQGPLFAGYDVARKKDLGVLVVVELAHGALTVVAVLVMQNTPFAQQKVVLENLTPILTGGCIDATGMGANIAEDMHAFDWHWSEVTFSAPMKAELAVDLRTHFQQQALVIPPDRDMHRDLHAVYRKVTEANNIVYDADRNNAEIDGHADRFWALALAVQAASRRAMPSLNLDHGPAPQGFGQRVKGIDMVTKQEVEHVVRPWVEQPVDQVVPAADAQAAVADQQREFIEGLYPALRRKKPTALPEAE